MARLGDICTKASSSIKQSDLENHSGNYPIYGASGFIKNVDFFEQGKPYVAVVKDGAGIGRVMKLSAQSSVISTMQYIIPNDGVDVSYLAYAMESMNLAKYYSGAAIPHIYFKDYCKEPLPLHSEKEQRHIAAVLDKVSDLIALRKQQLAKLDELVKARFVEMFGDPVANPKQLPTKLLLEMGSCKNGMNFHYDDTGVRIHCLGVGDFQNHSIISSTADLPMVSLNEMPSEDYLLNDDDIVFVRSNGNKALVGRSVAVYPGSIPTTFSGFCIRYRMHSNSVTTPYLLRVLKTDSIRAKMAGRGANIQNLNQQILASLSIPIPPMEQQTAFSTFVAKVNKSKSVIQQGLVKLETLKTALMQEYFG